MRWEDAGILVFLLFLFGRLWDRWFIVVLMHCRIIARLVLKEPLLICRKVICCASWRSLTAESRFLRLQIAGSDYTFCFCYWHKSCAAFDIYNWKDADSHFSKWLCPMGTQPGFSFESVRSRTSWVLQDIFCVSFTTMIIITYFNNFTIRRKTNVLFLLRLLKYFMKLC